MGHTLSRITMSLFYATDFADRLENQIIPALQAGFIVLSDRYFYSIMARDICARCRPGLGKVKIVGFALKPDLVLYLKAEVSDLVSRLIHGRGLNYGNRVWICSLLEIYMTVLLITNQNCRWCMTNSPGNIISLR